jgi:PTS system galactitol-specific IIA component
MKAKAYDQKTFFDEIFIHKINVDTCKDVIRELSATLYDSGAVTNQFQNAVLDREAVFPTGIPTKIPAALPHTDAEHCLKNALAVGILDKPVPFGLMGGEVDEIVDVNIVFMLSLPNPKSQVAVIQKMLEILRNDKTMELLIKNGREDVDAVRALLVDYFSNDEFGCSQEENNKK